MKKTIEFEVPEDVWAEFERVVEVCCYDEEKLLKSLVVNAINKKIEYYKLRHHVKNLN